MSTRFANLFLICLLLASEAQSQQPKSQTSRASQTKTHTTDTSQRSSGPYLSKRPTLYLVGYAHLDTEWRWEYPQTIQEYLSKTLRNNFALFAKYPHYNFNFTGANRYLLMKEY